MVKHEFRVKNTNQSAVRCILLKVMGPESFQEDVLGQSEGAFDLLVVIVHDKALQDLKLLVSRWSIESHS